jgi:MFS family permease
MPSGLNKLQVRKSLKNSVLDASFYSSMMGLTQNYISPFALAMKASTTQIGFLTGIPSLAQVLTQLVAPWLAEKARSRKNLIVLGSFLHGLMWLPVLLIPYVFHTHQVMWLIAFVTVLVGFDSLGNAPWNNMMAEIVPGAIRGRYFSVRNRVGSFVSFVLSFVAGGILQAMTGNIFLGFAIVFAGAMFSRFASVYFLSQMDEPAVVVPKSKQPGLFKLSLTLGSTNIGKFILFNALINVAVMFSSPFFSVYMLRDLKFNYVTYVIINAASTLATMLFMPLWGKRVDKFGTIQVLKVSSLFVPLVPVMWLFSTNAYYLCFAQVLGGFAWGGFSLAFGIFLYYAAPAQNRIRYIALSNTLMFGGSALGALFGGIIAPHLPVVMGDKLLTVFLISGVARAVIVILFISRIHETRQVPQSSFREVLFGGVGPADMKNPSGKCSGGKNRPDKN